MRRLAAWAACGLAVAAGCELPPGAPGQAADLAGAVRFDGGINAGHQDDLGGNHLPLDGGAGFGHLWFTVLDGDTRLPVPARVIFRPPPGAGFADSITSGKPDPKSPGSYTGAVVGPGVLGAPEGVLLVSGQGVVPVPAGTYSLFITRGPEYEAVETSVTVAAGEVQPIDAMLMRTVDTRGWLAADMHVHLNRSGDSRLMADRRVISMLTNGVEIIVPTDHNVNTDLAPVVTSLGYGGDLVGTVPGNESNFKEGHAGAWPVVFEPNQKDGGSTTYQSLDPRTRKCAQPIIGINCLESGAGFDALHQLVPGQTVVTINHPYWPTADLGYFTNIHWGAGTSNGLGPLATAGHFDALEVLSGYWTRADAIDNLTADWFYLLGQGVKVTALGNSDTHKINWVRAGFPRTWLRLPIDHPGDITGALLSDAVKHQRAIASTGPFITITVDSAQIGDTVIPRVSGQVQVALTVDAPAWITVDTVSLYVNGVQTHAFSVPPQQRPVLATTFNEPLGAGDAWIVAVASGQKPLPADVVGEYSHVNGYEMLPWAITNPVFVDGNGDGVWQPPASPMPAANGAMRLPYEPRTDRLNVPADCEPVRSGDSLPAEPLPTPERELMPLLYP